MFIFTKLRKSVWFFPVFSIANWQWFLLKWLNYHVFWLRVDVPSPNIRRSVIRNPNLKQIIQTFQTTIFYNVDDWLKFVELPEKLTPSHWEQCTVWIFMMYLAILQYVCLSRGSYICKITKIGNCEQECKLTKKK